VVWDVLALAYLVETLGSVGVVLGVKVRGRLGLGVHLGSDDVGTVLIRVLLENIDINRRFDESVEELQFTGEPEIRDLDLLPHLHREHVLQLVD
jgi:hypothetical protein